MIGNPQLLWRVFSNLPASVRRARGLADPSALAEPREAESEIFHPHVFIPALAVEDLFDDAFSPISESGAGTLAVGIRLQKTLRALSVFEHPEFRAAARHQSRLALERARHALALAEDVAKLERESSAI